MKRIPWVLCIAISGSVATGLEHENSDLDIFIITQKKRIWTARFWVFLFLKWHRKIATESDHAQKICPNHFISVDKLELKQKSKYTAQLFSHAFPVVDPYDIWPNFQEKNRDWIQSFGYGFQNKKQEKDVIPVIKNSVFGDLFEKLLEGIQRWKITRNPLTKLPNAQIILSDTELRFHPRPKSK